MNTSMNVRFLRRRNLGNFEHAELEVSDIVQEGSDKVSVVKGIMSFVQDALYSTGSFVGATTTVESVTKAAKVETAKKVETPKIETGKQIELPISEEKTQAPEAKGTEVMATLGTSEEKKEEVKKEETKKEEVKKATTTVKKETKVVTKPSKTTEYDRTLDAHKNNLGVFLDAKFPSWRKSDNIKKAVDASKALHGKPFLDTDGNILESFKEEFSKYMVNLV